MNYFKKFLNYAKEFWQEEEGVEFLEVAILVAIVVVLIAAIGTLFNNIGDKIEDSAEQVEAL